MPGLFLRLALAATLLAPGWAPAAHAQAAGDPCAHAPCKVSGAALRLTIPLPAKPGQFAGKWELVPLFDGARPRISNGHQLYAERNTIGFRTAAGDTVAAFAGSRTDLASIPALLWPVLPPDGSWGKAASIHDPCYQSRGTFLWNGHLGRTRTQPYTRVECDEILRQAMVALGVPQWKRVAIWSAVRIGGAAGWGT